MSESDNGTYSVPEESNVSMSKNELLNTIKVPQNLAQLTKRLPKSNYSKTSDANNSQLKGR